MGSRSSPKEIKNNTATVTDENGLYGFKELPEGEYKVHPVLPDRYLQYWFLEEEVMVIKGYAAYAEFMAGWNNRVEGHE